MPRRPPLPATHVIVHRPTGAVVSRHASLREARDAWRAQAFPVPGLIKSELGTWAAHHMILPAGAAVSAARRRAIESTKRSHA